MLNLPHRFYVRTRAPLGVSACLRSMLSNVFFCKGNSLQVYKSTRSVLNNNRHGERYEYLRSGCRAHASNMIFRLRSSAHFLTRKAVKSQKSPSVAPAKKDEPRSLYKHLKLLSVAMLPLAGLASSDLCHPQ